MATNTDDFEGEASQVNLDAHTPSGATGWVTDVGTASNVVVTTGGSCNVVSTSPVTHVSLDPQPVGANHYVQYKRGANTGLNYCLLRWDGVGANNWFGCHVAGDGTIDCYENDGGGFTAKGTTTTSTSAGDDIYLEADGDDYQPKINGTNEGSSWNDATHNDHTDWCIRGNAGVGEFVRDIEFGDLGGGPAAARVNMHTLLGVGS